MTGPNGPQVGEGHITINYDVDTASALGKVKSFQKAAEAAARDVHTTVRVDTAKAMAEMARWRQFAQTQGRFTVTPDVDSSRILSRQGEFRAIGDRLGKQFVDGHAARVSQYMDQISRDTVATRRIEDKYARDGERAGNAFTREMDKVFKDAVRNGTATVRPDVDRRSFGTRVRSAIGSVFTGADRDVDTHSHRWGQRAGEAFSGVFEGVLSLLPSRLESIFTRTGPVIGTALAVAIGGALMIALPAMISGLAGAGFVTLAAGALAAGIMLVKDDPRVTAAADSVSQMFHDRIWNSKGAEAMVQAVVPALNKIRDAIAGWAPWIDRILTAASKFLGPLTDGLIQFVNALLPPLTRLMESQFLKDLVDIASTGLRKVGEALGDVFSRILSDPEAMKGIKLGFEDLMNMIPSLIRLMGDVIIWAGKTWAKFNNDPDGAGPALSTMEQMKQDWKNFREAIEPVIKSLETVFGLLKKVNDVQSPADPKGGVGPDPTGGLDKTNFMPLNARQWGQMATEFKNGLADNFKIAEEEGHNKLVSMGASWLKTTQDVWLTPVAGLVSKAWDAVFSWLSQRASAFVSGFAEFFRGLGGTLSGIWNGITAFFSTAWSTIVAVFNSSLAWIQSVWNAVWGAVSSFFSVVWNGIIAAAQAAWAWLVGVYNTSLQWIQSVWNTVWDAIATFFSDIWRNIQAWAQASWDWIVGIYNSSLQWVQSIWNSVWDAVATFFSGIWQNIQAWAQIAWDWMVGIYQTSLDWISNLWNSVWDGMATFFSGIWENIKGWTESAITWVSDKIHAVLDTIANKWNEVWHGIGSILGDVWESIKGKVSDGIGSVISVLNQGIAAINAVLDKLGVGFKIDPISFNAAGARTGSGAFADGGRIGLASGGRVRGPGGPRDDMVQTKWRRGSIGGNAPLVSPQEFVVNAKSSKKLGYGTLNFLNEFGKLPNSKNYADGGQMLADGGDIQKAIAAAGAAANAAGKGKKIVWKGSSGDNEGLMNEHRNHVHVGMGSVPMSTDGRGNPAINALAAKSGIPNNPTSGYRAGDLGGRSWHAKGKATDFGGFNQDALAMFFAKQPGISELIHRSNTGDYGIFNGAGSILNEFLAKGIAWVMSNMINPALDKAAGMLPNTGIGALAKGVVGQKMKDALKKKIEEFISSANSSGGPGSGPVSTATGSVAQRAFSQASLMGATRDELIALFEAGIVESGFANSSNMTDHDSVGFLQQRPSQGWGTIAQIMDPAFATRSFLSRIKGTSGTPGQRAQQVQRSAFPAKYDAAQGQAIALLKQLGVPGFDNGGVWEPGSIGWNDSGKPEAVLTGPQWDAAMDNQEGDTYIQVYIDDVPVDAQVKIKKNNQDITSTLKRGRG